MNACYLSAQFSWEPENRACTVVYRTMKGPRLIRNPPGSSYYFSQWVLMKSCEGFPGCQVSVQNSDSEVCHYRNTSSLFLPPHGAKQKHHTLVSNFIYPITIAHVYTIKSVWLPERELHVTAGNKKRIPLRTQLSQGKGASSSERHSN